MLVFPVKGRETKEKRLRGQVTIVGPTSACDIRVESYEDSYEIKRIDANKYVFSCCSYTEDMPIINDTPVSGSQLLKEGDVLYMDKKRKHGVIFTLQKKSARAEKENVKGKDSELDKSIPSIDASNEVLLDVSLNESMGDAALTKVTKQEPKKQVASKKGDEKNVADMERLKMEEVKTREMERKVKEEMERKVKEDKEREEKERKEKEEREEREREEREREEREREKERLRERERKEKERGRKEKEEKERKEREERELRERKEKEKEEREKERKLKEERDRERKEREERERKEKEEREREKAKERERKERKEKEEREREKERKLKEEKEKEKLQKEKEQEEDDDMILCSVSPPRENTEKKKEKKNKHYNKKMRTRRESDAQDSSSSSSEKKKKSKSKKTKSSSSSESESDSTELILQEIQKTGKTLSNGTKVIGKGQLQHALPYKFDENIKKEKRPIVPVDRLGTKQRPTARTDRSQQPAHPTPPPRNEEQIKNMTIQDFILETLKLCGDGRPQTFILSYIRQNYNVNLSTKKYKPLFMSTLQTLLKLNKLKQYSCYYILPEEYPAFLKRHNLEDENEIVVNVEEKTEAQPGQAPQSPNLEDEDSSGDY
eukprot:TRINITY_DN2353_c0_g1_i1.p1 TRINITY_DN2353_c0_g1~~TRINITY_DN2353_c0_g1_i1.p1  ORF type:complete len:609 (+),score=255.55 TRINITY_DN2353_c0_g1_i1:34-1860(+)